MQKKFRLEFFRYVGLGVNKELNFHDTNHFSLKVLYKTENQIFFINQNTQKEQFVWHIPG